LKKKTQKKELFSWNDFQIKYNELSKRLQNDKTEQLTNAIFHGLDHEGHGVVSSELLLVLFEDINLKLKPVIDKIQSQKTMTFKDVYDGLSIAFQNSFDINDLLSVDGLVHLS